MASLLPADDATTAPALAPAAAVPSVSTDLTAPRVRAAV